MSFTMSSFCDFDLPAAHWNPDPPDNLALGNTLLFERALTRINDTLAETDGILRRILWHQGGSDTREECAALYESDMVELVNAFRTRIITDARGGTAGGVDADIPFVPDTMSKGKNSESDFSIFSPGKLEVDRVQRAIASLVPYAEVTNNDDLVPTNGFACPSSCVHFGAAAYQEMGFRMYRSLLRAANDNDKPQ